MHNVDEAVAEVLQFYKVYHSARWVGDKLVIRILQRLSGKVMVDLNQKFADLVREGEIAQGKAFRQEKNEPEIWSLPRLILTPHRRHFGRFRQLIDAINSSSMEPAGASRRGTTIASRRGSVEISQVKRALRA